MDGGIKVGKTKDIVQKRVKGLQTGNVEDIQVLLDYRTSNPDVLERMVHYVLDRYRCNSNREFFDCNVDYIKMVINVAGKTLDTLKSTYQHISEDQLLEKLGSHIQIHQPHHDYTMNTPNMNTPTNVIQDYQDFTRKYLTKGGRGVKWIDLFNAYKKWHVNHKKRNTKINKKGLKKYLETSVFKAPEYPIRNIGRGWYNWSLT